MCDYNAFVKMYLKQYAKNTCTLTYVWAFIDLPLSVYSKAQGRRKLTLKFESKFPTCPRTSCLSFANIPSTGQCKRYG